MARMPTRSCSTDCWVWPLRGRASFSRTTWLAMSKLRSVSQLAPAASSTTRWVKRLYFSSRSCTRSHRASKLMPGCSVHTPTIIIRLLGESIRSQAVSTLLMRSPCKPSTPLAVRRTCFCRVGVGRLDVEGLVRVTMACRAIGRGSLERPNVKAKPHCGCGLVVRYSALTPTCPCGNQRTNKEHPWPI